MHAGAVDGRHAVSAWAWLVRWATTAPCLGCSGRVRLRRPFGTRVAAYCERCMGAMGPFGACIRERARTEGEP